jgi:putative membrane protein
MFSALSESRIVSRLTVSAIALLALAACQTRQSDTTTDTMAGLDTGAAAPATAMAPGNPMLSDAEILQVVITANSADSAAGALATTQAKTASVKDFGKTMVKDHGNLNDKAQQLTQSASLTPQTSETSRQVQDKADEEMNDLKGKTGAGFDTAYVNHEVQSHQAVLDQLDQTLIPSAQNADLKQFLQNERSTVAAHLDRIKQLQNTVATSTGG